MQLKEVALVTLIETRAVVKLSKKERFVDFAVGMVALAVYLVTLAPTITWRNAGADSGDLVSAAFTLGIPHPTGYPLFTILAAIFSHLPLGEPAKNVNAFSALASAGAIALTSHIGRQLVEDSNPLARWIPPSIALAFAFAPAVWSQATIAEVNALAMFLTAALFAVLFSDLPHRPFFTGAIFGLGLAHHLTILLLLPAAIILLNPTDWTRSQLVRAALLLLTPLTLYLYLPLRASANPLINWGNPSTLDGFLWVISGAPYRAYLLAISPSEIFGRLALVARFSFEQFTVMGVALGLWGTAQMSLRTDAQTRQRFIALMLTFGLIVAYTVVYSSRDSFVYLTPAFFVFAFWMMYGVNDISQRLPFRGRLQTGDRETSQATTGFLAPLEMTIRQVQRTAQMDWRKTALAAYLVLFPLYNLAMNFGKMNVSSDYTAYDYAKNILTNVPVDAVIVADGDEHYFALQYYRSVVTPEKNQIIVSAELLQYSWYFDNIRRVLPNVNVSAAIQFDRVAEVMDASLAQGRGVYTTVRNEWFLPYALERRDGFYRVLGRLQ